MIYDTESITPALELTADGGAYFMKNTVALALAFADDPDYGTRVRHMVELAAAQATPDTNQFGETMTVIERNGRRFARQQVVTPHLWEGTLFYLTAMALHTPDAFFRHDKVLPKSRLTPAAAIVVPAINTNAKSGCACHQTASTWPSGQSLVVLLGLVLLILRANQRAAKTGTP